MTPLLVATATAGLVAMPSPSGSVGARSHPLVGYRSLLVLAHDEETVSGVVVAVHGGAYYELRGARLESDHRAGRKRRSADRDDRASTRAVRPTGYSQSGC